ncbi:deaminase domain-containing protein, partial [Anaeromicropila populeti]
CQVVYSESQVLSTSPEIEYVKKKEAVAYFKLPSKWAAWKSYFSDGLEQIILGKFTEKGTVIGTVGEVGLAFTGVDVYQDLRDLTHDIITWETTWEHFGETALDGIGLIPLVGALGKSDEILLFVKRTEKLYEIRRVAKIGENLLESLKKAGNALENAVDAASTAMKQVGSTNYRYLLNTLDRVKQGGRWSLATDYGTDFSQAFATYSSRLDSLSNTHPTAVQKAYRETIEECTDASGNVTKSVDEITEVAKKKIDEVVEYAEHSSKREREILQSGEVLTEGSEEWKIVRDYYADIVSGIREANRGVNNLGGNVSFTEALIDGTEYSIKGCSKPKNIEGFAPVLGDVNAKTVPERFFVTEYVDSQGNVYAEYIKGTNWNRCIDTEARTFEELALKLGATKGIDGAIDWGNINVKGIINLYTELKPCPSCLGVIEQFKEIYKNININVLWND